MQIPQWGYPARTLRPTPNPALAYSVLHITANLTSTAEGEAWYRINNPGVQVGATFFLNSDGSAVQCYADPRRMDPWTNGVLNGPDLTNPRIAAVVRDGVNPNERSLVTIEMCGYEPTRPITPAQEQTAAKIITWAHALIGMPVNRQTVVGHYQFDRVNRANCPSVNKSVIDRIVALASGSTDDVTITKLKAEDWLAKDQTQGKPLRVNPVRSDPVARYEKAIRSIAEIRTPAYTGSQSDGDWRLTEDALYVLRSDWNPKVPGGDPALDASFQAFVDGGSFAGDAQAAEKQGATDAAKAAAAYAASLP